MAHIFSLESVLRLRKHKEDAEQRALGALGAQRQQVETMLGRVQHELRQWTDERSREVGRAGSGVTQHSTYARLSLLRETRTQLEHQLKSIETLRREQQTKYLAARSGREMLTELKQQQQAASEAAEDRREQRQLEDLLLGRWSRCK